MKKYSLIILALVFALVGVNYASAQVGASSDVNVSLTQTRMESGDDVKPEVTTTNADVTLTSHNEVDDDEEADDDDDKMEMRDSDGREGTMMKGDGDDDDSVMTKEEVRTRNEGDDTRVRNEERVQTKMSELNERRAELIGKFVDRMVRVHSAAIDRMEKLADRIDSRITKFQESKPDVDLTLAEAELLEARAEIEEARLSLDGVDASVQLLLTGDDMRAAFGDIREIFADSRTNLKDSHQALVDSIVAIKASVRVMTEDGSSDDDSADDDSDDDSSDDNGAMESDDNGANMADEANQPN